MVVWIGVCQLCDSFNLWLGTAYAVQPTFPESRHLSRFHRKPYCLGTQMNRQMISPEQKELLRVSLMKLTGGLKVHFGIVNEAYPYADYVSDIVRRSDGQFGYTIAGHGIGSNTLSPASLDTTIERVLEHNQQWNAGESFTLEMT